MLSKTERDILKKISESQLISRTELVRSLDLDKDTNIDSVTRRLIERKLIASIAPVGSTCYIITQHGSQLLRELEA